MENKERKALILEYFNGKYCWILFNNYLEISLEVAGFKKLHDLTYFHSPKEVKVKDICAELTFSNVSHVDILTFV